MTWGRPPVSLLVLLGIVSVAWPGYRRKPRWHPRWEPSRTVRQPLSPQLPVFLAIPLQGPYPGNWKASSCCAAEHSTHSSGCPAASVACTALSGRSPPAKSCLHRSLNSREGSGPGSNRACCAVVVLLNAGLRGPKAPRAPEMRFCGLGVALKIEAGRRPAGLLRPDLQDEQKQHLSDVFLPLG